MIIRFPAYRRYTKAQVEVNDSMMALLIGARLGEHALKSSAASPEALLPSLFGQIPGIDRLNRTADDAAQLLADAEVHLAYMAIPYALAVHSAFIVSAAQMIREDGRDELGSYSIPRVEALGKLPLDTAHEYIVERCQRELDTDLLPLFHLTRRIRNRIVHFGGTPGSRLLQDYKKLPVNARRSWEELSGRSLLEIAKSERLKLGEPELVAVLAIGRHTARGVNDLLANTLSRTYWAELAVRDYKETHPKGFGQRDRRLHRVRGYAQKMYKPLGLSDSELQDAGAK